MKKILFLGANYYQATVIKVAKELGCYVITADYLPNNPGHKFADEYHNISTLDFEKIYQLAKKLKIDGIISYASDVSAPTAAYAAEKLGLPTNSLSSIEILTNKDKMRKFMEHHNFLVPQGEGFSDYKEGYSFFKQIKKPAMIKPVDSSGSKGVSKISQDIDFEEAWNKVLEYSQSKKIIVEEFLERDGYQIAGDGFLVNGQLQFMGLMNEHFDKLCNPLVPIGESYPSVISDHLKEKARKEIQRLLTLLNMKNGAVNLDFIVDKNENIYILEIGPRNGGNLITDATLLATGIDLAKYTVLSALGMDCSELKEVTPNSFVSSYIIHSTQNGLFDSIQISDDIKNDILRFDLFVKNGDEIVRFDNASFGIGAVLIKHNSIKTMINRMDNMEDYIKVIYKSNNEGGGITEY